MKKTLTIILIGVSLLLIPVICLATTFAYTHLQLALAKARDGVFTSPEEGMLNILQNSSAWVGVERVEIERAGQNSHSGKQPHVWFVTAKVYAERRWDGTTFGPGEYDYPGSYYLHTKEGWVHVPEGALPEFVGWGMELFDLAPE